MNVLGLIPARGGSKSIPKKNVVPILGKPLIVYTIEAAQASQRLSRTVVSTDDVEIAAIAKEWGAEVPFLRPPELARDDTPALPVIQHAVRYLETVEGWRADMIAYLQPTSPLRRDVHIDAAIDLLISKAADSVVSVVPVPHQFNPVSIMCLEEDHLVPFLSEAAPLLRRQDKPEVYARNGPAVLVCTYETVMRQNRLYGKRTLPLLMEHEESVDVDTAFDLALVEWILREWQ
jgi:CMP-N,N'-diacetyllegionaminic acid synthase